MSLKENMILNESAQAARLAEGYRKKYKDQVTALESSMLNKVVGVNEFHITQLGKQLDQFETYRQLCEATGTLNNLGQLPRIALDVVTATMGQSILSVIASTQAIGSQKGIVHFKNVEALNTKGNLNAGDVMVDPRTGTVTPEGYASNEVVELVGTGDGSETSFAAILDFKPTRNQFLQVIVDGEIIGKDQGDIKQRGEGEIWGQGVSGKIVYATGAISLTFAAAVLDQAKIQVKYQENYEAADDIPAIEAYWDSKDIEAKVYALKTSIGMLQQFTLQKEYGESAVDELSKDLIRAVNSEVGGDLVKIYKDNAMGSTTFTKAALPGVSYFDHKMEYMDKMNEADSVLLSNAGRGQISVMMVGRNHAALVAGLPGFQKLSDGSTLGAHVFGTLNGVTYIRMPNDSTLGSANAGIGIFRGSSPFESCGVYAPYMPLMSTQDLPALNPLVTQKAVATMAAVDCLVPQYATEFKIA